MNKKALGLAKKLVKSVGTIEPERQPEEKGDCPLCPLCIAESDRILKGLAEALGLAK